MRLDSDFDDYYDLSFDSEGVAFGRRTDRGLSKRAQLFLLEKAGYVVPPHGRVGDVLDTWWEAEKRWVRDVVVYEDEMAHCGDGKRLLKHHDFQQLNCKMNGGPEAHRLSNLYCTAFVGLPHTRPQVSWRHLQVGRHAFWLEYHSDDDWRSNCGREGGCKVIGVEMNAGFHPYFSGPQWALFAIDFVLGREQYAVDLNTAPGIRGSGVERLLSPKATVEAIREAVEGCCGAGA